MSRFQKTCLAITIVVAIGIAIVAYSTLGDRHTTEERDAVTISEALSMYWKDNGRYPEDLDVLFEQYGLKQEQTQDYSFSPAYHYGSYHLDYRYDLPDGFVVMNLGGPPPTEVSRKVTASTVEYMLLSYYDRNGRYPDTLLECVDIDGEPTELIEVVEKENFAYSVSEDKQSCSLDGRTIEPFHVRVEKWKQEKGK